jgi:hypothetical protein
MTVQHAPRFSAADIFDPQSFYNRLRSGFQPELKLRGLFFELQALREAQRQSLALAAAPGRDLVLYADDPGRRIDVRVTDTFQRVGPHTTRLLLSVQIIEAAEYPAPKTRCRAFLLTRGMLERLCGPSAPRPVDWARTALQHLFEDGGKGEPGEIARVLAAAPEMSGEFGRNGRCAFPPFDLPRQASDFDAFAEVEAILVLLDRLTEETNE